MKKSELEEFIYELNNNNEFFIYKPSWASPTVGFSYDKSRSIKFMNELMKKNLIKEDRQDVICILADWENVAEGIFFTDKAIYVDSPKNQRRKFRVSYDEIESVIYKGYTDFKEVIIKTESDEYAIDSLIWSKRNIKIFLEFATERMNFNDEEDLYRVLQICYNSPDLEATIFSGIVYGNISNASTIYGYDKFRTLRGHGFAAENANHLYDKIMGKDARLVGGDNVKNGADRNVDGVNIQSKYCKTGSECISECFKNGKFRYLNTDGTPMEIEVPSDKYQDAVKAMRNRIEKGEVPGVTDPNEATNIVRKGRFSYAQAKNIAKAGTIESITFDSVNGIMIASKTMGISSAITFAISIWNGEDVEVALKNSIYAGFKVGGSTFLVSILSSQLSRAGLNSLLVGSSEAIVEIIGPKASAVIINAFRSGSNIYGAAAMKSLAKMFRNNIITGGISVVLLSSVDIINIFKGRVSSAQLFKNVTNTVSTVAGGTAGWITGTAVGAKIGTAIFPGIGTMIGTVIGLAGATAGGKLASDVSGKVLNNFIEDDAEYLVKIIQSVFEDLATEYLLTEKEAENIVDNLSEKLNGKVIKDMYQAENKRKFVRNLITPLIEEEIVKRNFIYLPSEEDLIEGLKVFLEDMHDNGELVV